MNGPSCPDRARRSYSLLILAYGLRIRCCVEPKSTTAAIPSSIPVTRPRPCTSCVTWSPTANCLGGSATGTLKAVSTVMVGSQASGTISAMILGPQLAGLRISPLPHYLVIAILLAVAIALLGSIPPVHRAALVDPAVIMQEV